MFTGPAAERTETKLKQKAAKERRFTSTQLGTEVMVAVFMDWSMASVSPAAPRLQSETHVISQHMFIYRPKM